MEERNFLGGHTLANPSWPADFVSCIEIDALYDKLGVCESEMVVKTIVQKTLCPTQSHYLGEEGWPFGWHADTGAPSLRTTVQIS